MKVLKAYKKGLIAFEDFNNGVMNDIFIANANFIYGDSCILISRGGIFVNASPYVDLVIEIDNEFIPSVGTDVGGISIIRGQEKREFLEYYSENQLQGAVPRMRVVKNGDVFTGYTSIDGNTWTELGYVIFTGAETIGVSAYTYSPYKLNWLKLYSSEFVKIYQLMPNWTVSILSNNLEILSKTVTNDNVVIKLPYYPFSGQVKIYDDENNLVTDMDFLDVWGGDEYICTANIEIYNELNEMLTLFEQVHLGKLHNGKIEQQFKLKSIDNVPNSITMKILETSPFYDWVTIAIDNNGTPGTYGKSIPLYMVGGQETYFWIYITKPTTVLNVSYDFRYTDCLFYLEVE